MFSRRRSGAPIPDNGPARPKLRNQILFVVAILALAGGAFSTALVVFTQIDRIFFPDSELRLPVNLPGIDSGGDDDDDEIGGRRINVLVMGLDRRPSEGGAPARTDTMFVMTIDPSTHTARGLAIPRDLLVDIETPNGVIQERINTAYVLGEAGDYPGGGVATVTATVETLLGIKLDHYMLIDFDGFKQVIDLLGGVEVDVPVPGVNDPLYSETELPGDYYPCVFEPGRHHMGGSDALCYARVRRNSSDLDRILRQQRIMLAVMDKATQLKVLANVSNVVSLWRNYKDAIETDVNDLQIPGFAKLVASIDPDQLAFLSIGAATTPYTTAEGAQVLLPSAEGIKQIVDAFISDNRLLQEGAVVEVQNGTDEEGRATLAVEYFVSLGLPLDSLSAISAAELGHTRTEIIDYTGKSYTAKRLADWLGLPKDRVRKPTAADEAIRISAAADIVVILGTDARLETAVAPSSP